MAHDVLLPTYNRQIIGLVRNNSKMAELKVQWNSKHHPLTLFTETKGKIRQSVSCAEQIVDINIMNSFSSIWTKMPSIDKQYLERLDMFTGNLLNFS